MKYKKYKAICIKPTSITDLEVGGVYDIEELDWGFNIRYNENDREYESISRNREWFNRHFRKVQDM